MKPHNVLMADDGTPVLMDFGSMGTARVEIKGTSDALALQDLAAERCSMPYRAPELFNVQSYGTIDERIDIWVGLSLINLSKKVNVYLNNVINSHCIYINNSDNLFEIFQISTKFCINQFL